MTATANKEPGEDQERPFWASFGQADMRLLVVTFLGTVAANVIAIVVVATAIIAARFAHSQHANVVILLANGAYVIAFGTGAIYYWVKLIRIRRYIRHRVLWVVFQAAIVVSALSVLAFLLTVVGLAAGIK